MGFMDVLISAGTGFLLGGPAGAVAGGIAAFAAEGEDEAAKPMLSNTSLTKASGGTAAAPAPAEQTLLQKIGSAISGGAAAVAGEALAPEVTAAVTKGGFACPTNKNRVRTIIQTISPAGKVIRQSIEKGRPFLMNRDIVIAKRVFRTVAKVSGRLPKRTVKQSAASMLKDAAIDKAMRDVLTDNGHHHNGNGS